jgi:hypothetical protein
LSSKKAKFTDSVGFSNGIVASRVVVLTSVICIFKIALLEGSTFWSAMTALGGNITNICTSSASLLPSFQTLKLWMTVFTLSVEKDVGGTFS